MKRNGGFWCRELIRALCLVVILPVMGVFAEVSKSMENGFVDHGIPIKVSSAFSTAVGIDREGKHHFYQARGQSPTPFYVLDTCLETGESVQTNCTIPDTCFPWGMCAASNGLLYIGTATSGHLFEYDPITHELKDLGVPGGETYIWNLVEGTDKKIYGCTYGHCKLIRYDPETGVTEDLGRMDPTEQYLRTLGAADDGFIYGGIGSSKFGVIAYDIENATWEQLIPQDIRDKYDHGWGQIFECEDGFCYAKTPDGLYRLSGGKAEHVGSASNMPPVVGKVCPDGVRLNGHNQDKQQFSIKFPDSDEIKFYDYEEENAGTRLFVVTRGPDDNIYGSSFLPLRLFVYNPDIDESTNLGKTTISTGEIYSFCNFKGDLVMAAYPGCSMGRYDPKEPLVLGDKDSGNPRRVPRLSKLVYRPHEMCIAPDGEKILICGMPDYGMLGGSLSVFNPDTMEMEAEYRHLIQDQSVACIGVTKEGLVVGGSSVAGGSGSHPTETQAMLFLWDYEKREKVFEMAPVEGIRDIRALLRGPDDLIYCMGSKGDFFVFDSGKREIVHYEKLEYGDMVLHPMEMSEDGKIIVLSRSKMFEIEPGTFKHRLLVEAPMGIGGGTAVLDGRVYFFQHDHLYSWGPLPE